MIEIRWGMSRIADGRIVFMAMLAIGTFRVGASFAQEPPAERAPPQIGPPNGSLVIVGGGRLDAEIRLEFLRLAGGVDAPIVVIPTAAGGREYDAYNSGLQSWKQLGATDLTVLHTTDRAVSDTDAFVEPIKRARGDWIGGGRQLRLVDAYINTKVQK